MLRAVNRAGLIATATVTLLACATTGFQSSWKNPAAQSFNLGGRRVAALVLSEEETLRYAAEDALARGITTHGAVGVPAYTLLPTGLARDGEKARELLEKAEVEGVVALRPRAGDESLPASLGSHSSSSRYASLWGPGFWGRDQGGAEDGDLRVGTALVVETLVYRLPQNELVWASQSQAVSPSEVGSFIHELSRRVGAELAGQGLLADPAQITAVGF